MDDPSHGARSSEHPTAYCDSCGVKISEGRYKCRACYDFDYCPKCFQEAALIHPGHDFTFLESTPAESPRIDESKSSDATRNADSQTSDYCRCCKGITYSLPILYIVLKEFEQRRRRELEDWLTRDIPDDTTPEDPAFNKAFAEELYQRLEHSYPVTLEDLESLPWTKIHQHYEKQYEGLDAPRQGGEEEEEEVAEEVNEAQLAGIAKVMQQSLGGEFPISFHEYSRGENKNSNKSSRRRKSPTEIAFLLSLQVFATTFCDTVMDVFGSGIRNTWYTKPQEHGADRERVISNCMEKLTKLKYDRFDFYIMPICSKKDLRLPDFNKLRFGLTKAADDYEILRETFRYSGALLPASSGRISFEVDAYTTDDDPVARLLTSRTPNPSPASDKSFRLIKEWISQCDENHSNTCLMSSNPQSNLPRRLIEIGDGDCLQLHESSPGEQGQYVVLSYCWGGPQEFQTTTSTIDTRRAGFSISELPMAIQDAIRVTQSLGVKYIWVDSLCIVQDDPSDKAYNISQMAQVYKNSHLTICASRAGSATEGCLFDNADKSTGLWKGLIPLACRVPDPAAGTREEATFLPGHLKGTLWLHDESDGIREMVRDATSRRGWCLQEQILSPRLLSYGRWPTWRCRGATYTDGGYYASDIKMRDDTGTLANRLVDMLFDPPQSSNLSPGLDVFSMTQLYQAWYALVHDTSKRELGCASDRLPAIGGIAVEISRLTGSRYLAGLWEHNILHDLMWLTKTREWSRRPLEWRAPSWSWASVDSTIIYGNITADSRPLATVRRCTVTLKYPISPFGEVSEGSIEVQGPFALLDSQNVNGLLEEQSIGPAQQENLGGSEWLGMILGHSEDVSGTRRFNAEKGQAEEPPRLEGPVYGLITFSRDWRIEDENKINELCFSGLFLKESEGSAGCFERVGSFVNETKEWLDPRSESWKNKSIVIL